MKKSLQYVLRFGVSLALLAFLVQWTRANNPEVFTRLVEEPKHWWLMLAGFVVFLTAVLTSFVRWYFLVVTVRLPFTVKDSIRLGFLGYYWSFFLPSSVGGDVVKALAVAKEHPERRAVAVATVVVDRVIGLYGLILVTTLAFLGSGLYRSSLAELQVISKASFLLTAVGALGIFMLIIPGLTTGAGTRMLTSLPKVGPVFAKLIQAIRMYRQNPVVLFLVGLMSLANHTLMALSVYLLALGLPGSIPSLLTHLVIVPIAALAGAIPLSIAGLGQFEGALEYLYMHVPYAKETPDVGQGFLAALAFRVVNIAIAAIGACYYYSARRELQDLVHEAEQPTDDESNVPN